MLSTLQSQMQNLRMPKIMRNFHLYNLWFFFPFLILCELLFYINKKGTYCMVRQGVEFAKQQNKQYAPSHWPIFFVRRFIKKIDLTVFFFFFRCFVNPTPCIWFIRLSRCVLSERGFTCCWSHNDCRGWLLASLHGRSEGTRGDLPYTPWTRGRSEGTRGDLPYTPWTRSRSEGTRGDLPYTPWTRGRSEGTRGDLLYTPWTRGRSERTIRHSKRTFFQVRIVG